MPKISVQLEADSAEEFRALLSALYATVPMTGVTAGRAAQQSLSPQELQPEEQQEPEASQGPSEAEQPTAEAKEPAQPRRGRPRKEKPTETPVEAAAVEPAPEAPAVADSATAKADSATAKADSATVKADSATAKAKPKAMPHAQPENGAATRQDLLDAFSEYVQRYGASFGFSDISSLLQKNLGDGVRKASDVPEDKLPVAIGAIKTAIADNPFNRKRDYA